MSKKPFNYQRATCRDNKSPTRNIFPLSSRGRYNKSPDQPPRPQQQWGIGHGKPANRNANNRGSSTSDSSTAGRSRQFAAMYSLFGSQSSLYSGDLSVGRGGFVGNEYETTDSDARSSGTTSSLGPSLSGSSSSGGIRSGTSSWGVPSTGFSTEGSGTSLPVHVISGPGLGEAITSPRSVSSSGSSSAASGLTDRVQLVTGHGFGLETPMSSPSDVSATGGSGGPGPMSSPSDVSATGGSGGPGSLLSQEPKLHRESGMWFPYCLSECPMLETYHRLPILQFGDAMERAEEVLDQFTNNHLPRYISGLVAQAPSTISYCPCVVDRWQQTLQAANHDFPVHFIRCVCDQCGHPCCGLTCLVFVGDLKVRINEDACSKCYFGADKTVFDYARRLT